MAKEFRKAHERWKNHGLSKGSDTGTGGRWVEFKRKKKRQRGTVSEFESYDIELVGWEGTRGVCPHEVSGSSYRHLGRMAVGYFV